MGREKVPATSSSALMGHRIEGGADLDVIVGMDAPGTHLEEGEALGRQPPERRPVDGQEVGEAGHAGPSRPPQTPQSSLLALSRRLQHLRGSQGGLPLFQSRQPGPPSPRGPGHYS
jgi:hypothetical protein